MSLHHLVPRVPHGWALGHQEELQPLLGHNASLARVGDQRSNHELRGHLDAKALVDSGRNVRPRRPPVATQPHVFVARVPFLKPAQCRRNRVGHFMISSMTFNLSALSTCATHGCACRSTWSKRIPGKIACSLGYTLQIGEGKHAALREIRRHRPKGQPLAHRSFHDVFCSACRIGATRSRNHGRRSLVPCIQLLEILRSDLAPRIPTGVDRPGRSGSLAGIS
jgi:hypothetical protein